MRVLITGAAGMLGLDVIDRATRAGDEAVGLSRAELDITDSSAVAAALSRLAPEAVINCAAYTKVDDAEADPAGARAVNATGPGVLGAAAAAAGAWLVHVSTDYVFDGTKRTGPYRESDPTGPRSVYGLTKLEGERALAAVAPDSHTVARTSWLFGSGGPCFPATILRAAATREELSVVDDQTGSPTYTPHLAEALLELARKRSLTGVCHIAAEGQTTWFGFASALVAAASAERHDAAGGSSAAAGGDGPGVRDGSASADRSGSGGWASVSPCTTDEFPRPAPRPAYSVLRSEREGVPVLPDWQLGMEAYMADWETRAETAR